MTNASIVLAPVGMLSSDFRPSLPLPRFNKHLLGAEHGDEPQHGGLTLRLGLHQQVRTPQAGKSPPTRPALRLPSPGDWLLALPQGGGSSNHKASPAR